MASVSTRPITSQFSTFTCIENDIRIDRASKDVFRAILSRRGPNETAWPSVRCLARDTGMSAGNVSKCISRLTRWGVLERDVRPGSYGRAIRHYSIPELGSIYGKSAAARFVRLGRRDEKIEFYADLKQDILAMKGCGTGKLPHPVHMGLRDVCFGKLPLPDFLTSINCDALIPKYNTRVQAPPSREARDTVDCVKIEQHCFPVEPEGIQSNSLSNYKLNYKEHVIVPASDAVPTISLLPPKDTKTQCNNEDIFIVVEEKIAKGSRDMEKTEKSEKEKNAVLAPPPGDRDRKIAGLGRSDEPPEGQKRAFGSRSVAGAAVDPDEVVAQQEWQQELDVEKKEARKILRKEQVAKAKTAAPPKERAPTMVLYDVVFECLSKRGIYISRRPQPMWLVALKRLLAELETMERTENTLRKALSDWPGLLRVMPESFRRKYPVPNCMPFMSPAWLSTIVPWAEGFYNQKTTIKDRLGI